MGGGGWNAGGTRFNQDKIGCDWERNGTGNEFARSWHRFDGLNGHSVIILLFY